MIEKKQKDALIQDQTDPKITEPAKSQTEDKRQEEEAQTQEQELETEQPSELETLRAELAEMQAKVEEYLDGWQRSRAEFVNFRRRQEQWGNSVREQAASGLLANLLPVLDDLERAFEEIPKEMCDDAWVEGFSLMGHKLGTVLKKEGLSEVAVQPGNDFDPNYHQAILHEPSTEFDEGKIIDVFQKGYKLNNIILRPAVVRVSSGKIDES